MVNPVKRFLEEADENPESPGFFPFKDLLDRLAELEEFDYKTYVFGFEDKENEARHFFLVKH